MSDKFLSKNKNELLDIFVKYLLITNRGFNYYVDWNNINGYESFNVEIHAIDVLIGEKDDKQFEAQFRELVLKLPKVVLLFPFLFGLAKVDRERLYKGKESLCIIHEEIGEEDNLTYQFSQSISALTIAEVSKYYDFFVKMGLKHLFQNLIEKSTMDYITGVLVGMDSNGRKNRGGQAFELACLPIFEQQSKIHQLKLLKQKQFKELINFGFAISDDVANRKADFIVVDEKNNKAMNFEVNFYNGGGSKPEEIINSYIQRQKDLKKCNPYFRRLFLNFSC